MAKNFKSRFQIFCPKQPRSPLHAVADWGSLDLPVANFLGAHKNYKLIIRNIININRNPLIMFVHSVLNHKQPFQLN